MMLTALHLIFLHSVAQYAYSLVHYNEDVLPQTSVGNIEQDENGYLWMNTQYGIVRFDGETVRAFTTDNVKGLSSNRIRLCAKGLDRSVYLVDENNVIIKVKSPNRFETIATMDCLKKATLPLYSSESNNDFAYLKFDKKAELKQFMDSLKFDLTREFLKSYAISEKEGYLFYIDVQQKVRLCYYDGKNYQSTIQSDSFKAQHTFKLNNFIFNQTNSKQAYLFDEARQKREIRVTGLPPRFNRTFKEETAVLFSNATGTFFYSSGKLYRYKLKTGAIEATLVFEDLPCIGVTDIMQERTTGDFLISTKSTGFYRIKKKQFDVINVTSTSKEITDPTSGLSNNITYAISLWDQKHIFCNRYITPVLGGTARNFDPSNKKRFDYFFLHCKDSSHIWVNFEGGIHSFDKVKGSYTPLLNISRPKKAVELSNGTTIIVAARNIVSIKNNTVTKLYESETNEFITAEKITDDCLAVGMANGFYYFYPSKRKLQAVPYKEALKVRFILKDKSGRLWFTTYGQGLFYLSGNTIISLPLDNAGSLAISHSIVEDNRGYFWITTNHGLFKLHYASLLLIIGGKSSKLYYTYYDKTDGFNTNEFNGGCYPSSIMQKETGAIFFPSMNGIVKFNPDSIWNITSNSPVFFDEIVVDDTIHVYTIKDKIIFPGKSSSVRINFSSPYYGHAENVKFSYALSNAPDQWKDLKRNRSIVLSNLPGGSYTLFIKKEGPTNAGIVNSFNFEIKKKFSETIFFKLLLLASVIALVYAYFRARLYYLHKERKRLEKLVIAKTADQLKLIDQQKESIERLTQLQQELEQMIGHKENILAVLIHDIKSPLYFLNTVATHLHNRIMLNPGEKNKEIAYEIANSLNRLYLFTQDFANWLNASQPGKIQKREQVNLEKIIGEALAVYKEIIDKKNICIRQQASKKWVYSDEPMIKSIIRNLVDNAVKNASGGQITITTAGTTDKGVCEIIIADEGKGMTEEQMAALNHYFQYNDDILSFSNAGFGHKVIKDFLQKLGGTISYRQNKITGVIVTVNLTLTQQPEMDKIHAGALKLHDGN